MSFNLTPGRTNFSKTGNGISPMLQVSQEKETVATRADSLLVRNQSLKQSDFYRKSGYIPYSSSNPDYKQTLSREDLKSAIGRKNEQLKRGDLTTVIEGGKTTRREYDPKKESYSKDINKYAFQHNESANWIINKDAPQSITDTRIKPSGSITLINPKTKDVVNYNNYQDLKISTPTPPVKSPPTKTPPPIKPTMTSPPVSGTSKKTIPSFKTKTGSESIVSDAIRDNTRIGTSFGTKGMYNQIDTKIKRNLK